MAKLPRKFQKQFGDTAVSNDVSRFGSLASGSPVFTKDPDSIQQLGNFDQGWRGGILGNNSPALQDMNALFYLYAYQLRYLFQQGISEWNSSTEYNDGSLCTGSFGIIYKSKTNLNINNPLSSLTNWVPVSTIGGHKIVWSSEESYDSFTVPQSEIYPNVGPIFRFGSLDKNSNKITYNWTVPQNYIPESAINLRFSYFTEETSNNLRWEVIVKIIKSSEDAIDDPSETYTVVGSVRSISSTSKKLEQQILNLRTGIESYVLQPGDIMRIELKQASTGNTSVQDVLMIANNSEIVL